MKINNQKNVECVIGELMKELAALAPHPSRPHYRGPLLVGQDGMMGAFLMDAMIGSAFLDAVSHVAGGWVQSVNWDQAVDMASEFHKDRSSPALGQRHVIANDFNVAGKTRSAKKKMDAYLADLPRRIGLEKKIAHYRRKSYAAKQYAAKLAVA